MQQQVSVITLGVADVERARRFYGEGFGWEPVFANEEVVFFQMNGLMLALWQDKALAEDSRRGVSASGGFALAHNVGGADEVDAAMARLVSAGATLLRTGDAPPHGGFRGYVADPDGHAWEIAWNPAWPIDSEGHVRFGS